MRGGALDVDLLLILLNFVRTTGFLKHRASVAEAEEKSTPRPPAPPAVVRRHLLWLLKYDLLRLGS